MSDPRHETAPTNNRTSSDAASDGFYELADHAQRFEMAPAANVGGATNAPSIISSTTTGFTMDTSENPFPAYGLERSDAIHGQQPAYIVDGSVDSSAPSTTTYNYNPEIPLKDATETVHKMYMAMLYLLSNPEEFQKTIAYYEKRGNHSTLSAWNAEMEDETRTDVDGTGTPPPLPFVVFADDAEVVLPQAHTASQLFGLERAGGIELEAAAGLLSLSQLFLRWLALMPGGDHMNVIEPPGLTVMRIAGGRYRVTGAHRVVWTWMNQFLPEAMPTFSGGEECKKDELPFEFGDLVTMTIVDVFETDKDGKLLSYCPTFDNRAIKKTTQSVERIRKGSSVLKSSINVAANSQTAAHVNKAAGMLARLGIKAAVSVGDSVKKKIAEERQKAKNAEEHNSKGKPPRTSTPLPTAQETRRVAEAAYSLTQANGSKGTFADTSRNYGTQRNSVNDQRRGELYLSDDDTTDETR